MKDKPSTQGFIPAIATHAADDQDDKITPQRGIEPALH